MTTIPFNVTTLGDLSDELALGFTRLSSEKLANKLVIAIYLWHPDGTGLKVSSEMNDLSGWIEVGSLKFSRVTEVGSGVVESATCEVTVSSISLPAEFNTRVKASKLVLNTNGVFVESGIVFEGADGGEIILVAGASPYSISTSILDISGEFEPEYSLDSYIQKPF